MLTMMGQKFKRDESAVYSFLLAVPTILAASGLEIIKTDFKVLSNTDNLMFLAVGFIVSFITAYFSVKWLISFLKNNSLTIFGIYRLLLSFVLIML